MSADIRKERVYPQSPEDVWIALTDPHALAEWLMPNNFAPVLGHRFRFQVDPMPGTVEITECEVIEIDPPRRLVYTWSPVPKNPTIPRPTPSVVTWTLTPEGGGTRIVLEHTGIRDVFPWWQRYMLRFGWGTIVKRFIPTVLKGVREGKFIPGVIPLQKRCYKVRTIPAEMVR